MSLVSCSSLLVQQLLVYTYTVVSGRVPMVEHLTSLPKRGESTLLSVSAFNHERAPMSCLQRLDALEANNWTTIMYNGATMQQLQSRVLMAHNTLNSTMTP